MARILKISQPTISALKYVKPAIQYQMAIEMAMSKYYSSYYDDNDGYDFSQYTDDTTVDDYTLDSTIDGYLSPDEFTEEALFKRSFGYKYHIIFYNDVINNPDDIHEFDSIVKFADFLTTKGIYVSYNDANALFLSEETHCTYMNEFDDQSGCNFPKLIMEQSYGSLRFAVAESNDDLLTNFAQ